MFDISDKTYCRWVKKDGWEELKEASIVSIGRIITHFYDKTHRIMKADDELEIFTLSDLSKLSTAEHKAIEMVKRYLLTKYHMDTLFMAIGDLGTGTSRFIKETRKQLCLALTRISFRVRMIYSGDRGENRMGILLCEDRL